MRKVIVATLLVTALIALGGGSVIKVSAGEGAWCRGRYLGPGLQIKPPFARISRYEASDQTLQLTKSLAGETGEPFDFEFTVRYRWDFQRLPTDPLDPMILSDELLRAVGGPRPSTRAGELGWLAEANLRKRLAELPIILLDLSTEYPSPALERFRGQAQPTGERVVLVGMDGLDWVLLDRLIDEGRCPTFAEMKRSGAWGEIVSRQPVLSPLIWTTMATGRLPEDHGVADFVVTDAITGKDMPITNQSRKVHAFWNLLSYAGMTVNVVNWWATYPAESINGVMVSERVFYQLFGIRPSLDDPANIAPANIAGDLLSLLVEADDIGYDEVHRYASISRAEFSTAVAESRAAENPFENRINHLRKIIATTDGVFNVGRWLLSNRPADLTAIYIEGTDTIGHRFAHFLPPKLSWVSQEDYDRYHETMADYYEFCDRRLAELMDLAPPDTTWLIVADHGFYTGRARPSVLPDDFATGAPQWHRMVGVFMATGPRVRPGKIRDVHIDDLCRTVLWLLGAPSSHELLGKALTSMTGPEWTIAHPPIETASYADLPHTWISGSARSNLDEARIQELRALGYIVDDEPSARGQPTPATDEPPSIGSKVKATEPYNLGKIAYGRNDLDAAERYFLRALELEPRFAAAMISLASVYRDRGDHQSSLRWILRALDTGSSTLRANLLIDMVREAEAAGVLDRALPALEMVRNRWQEHSSFYTARGIALQALNRADEAEGQFRIALTKDPADPTATEQMLRLATRGRAIDTDRILEAHLAAVKNNLKRLNQMAVVCLRQQRPDFAERALQLLLESDPSNAGIISNLAVALQMQGRGEEAARVLEDAVQARPDDADLRFNYGAVLASLGRYDEALPQLEASERLGNRGPAVVIAKAKVLVRLNRIDEAHEVLSTGARAHPDDPEIRELLEILQSGG